MRKAISALIPYAIFLERGGQRRMVDVISRAARASSKHDRFVWNRVLPYIAAIFDKPNPPSLNWVLELAAPHVLARDRPRNEKEATRKATTISYTGEASRNVVNGLLQIAFTDPLQPQIPDGFPGESGGAGRDLTRQVRALGNIEILKSYLLLAWSGYSPIDEQSGGLAEMLASIREDFSGIGMGRHREELIERLNLILGRSDLEHHRRYESPNLRDSDTQRAKEQYEELRRVLLEVDAEAVNTLTRTSSRSTPLRSTDTHPHVQDPIRPSCVLSGRFTHDCGLPSGIFGLLPPADRCVCTLPCFYHFPVTFVYF